MKIWLILFAGMLGSSPGDMKAELWVGPLDDYRSCYAMAAIAIDRLNDLNPDTDFRAACVDDDAEHPHMPSPSVGLDLHELARRAGAVD